MSEKEFNMDRKVLGRGLNALISQNRIDNSEEERIESLPLEGIKPNPFQPREEFAKEAIDELKSSIKEKGIIQPIVVRRGPTGFELIAGERRYRAAKELGMSTIPSVVKSIDDQDALELSLIENVQRVDLNPIEEALGYKYLIDKFNLTQEKISDIVGKSRPAIANILRLLNLPKEIQDAMKKGAISMAHGRVLLEIDDMHQQMSLLSDIIAKSLSVRELEGITKGKRFSISKRRRVGTPARHDIDPKIYAIQEFLQGILGTKVRVTKKKKYGKIEIEFYSTEDLDRIVKLVGR